MGITVKDIKALDLNLLKALDALLVERNVTRAAKRLGVTQPAMSGMLARLRDTFDDQLFVRAQRGIIPTARAQALAAPLQHVMREVGTLLQPSTFDPSTAQQTFTIAATDYALRVIAVPFLLALKQQAPHVRVALVSAEGALLHTQLERGEIDLALVTPDDAFPELRARTLFDERYVCALREGHPVLQGGTRLTLDQFCALDHALVSFAGDRFHGVTDDALEKLGRKRTVSLSVKCFLILPDVLRTSDMVAILPSRLVNGVPGLRIFDPPIEVLGFTKVAVWHERTHHDASQRWLREQLFRSCAELSK